MIFKISEEATENANKFIEKHYELHKGKYLGAIGGAITFSFTDTSIGQMQSVKCFCGESELINGDEI